MEPRTSGQDVERAVHHGVIAEVEAARVGRVLFDDERAFVVAVVLNPAKFAHQLVLVERKQEDFHGIDSGDRQAGAETFVGFRATV